MDLEELKALMTEMERQGIKKLEMKDERGVEIKLERETAPEHVRELGTYARKPEEAARLPSSPLLKEEAASGEKKGADYVTSPMVGTFYGSPSPEEPPFVKVGDTVEEDTVICIIEAMKVMNEVKAGKKGRIGSILVNNAHPVDFGTKLFELVGGS